MSSRSSCSPAGIALALLFGRRWPLLVTCLVMAMSAINVAVFG
jgi:hypothetical protein